jgi:hypothetical protein
LREKKATFAKVGDLHPLRTFPHHRSIGVIGGDPDKDPDPPSPPGFCLVGGENPPHGYFGHGGKEPGDSSEEPPQRKTGEQDSPSLWAQAPRKEWGGTEPLPRPAYSLPSKPSQGQAQRLPKTLTSWHIRQEVGACQARPFFSFPAPHGRDLITLSCAMLPNGASYSCLTTTACLEPRWLEETEEGWEGSS